MLNLRDDPGLQIVMNSGTAFRLGSPEIEEL